MKSETPILKHCKVCGLNKLIHCFRQEDGYQDGIGRHQCIACISKRRQKAYRARKVCLPIRPFDELQALTETRL